MPLFTEHERDTASAIGSLVYENPFLPGRLLAERRVLGEAFQAEKSVWSLELHGESNPNLTAIAKVAEELAEKARSSLPSPRRRGEKEEINLYEDLVTYVLYDRYSERLAELALRENDERVPFYDAFAADAQHFLEPAGLLPSSRDLAHLFALFYQVRRAFLHIFTHLVGTSLPAATLRADVWCSIFTRDLRRYRRALHERMGDIPTLIIGPTGTGKELVARAIALSRYIPFDERTRRFAAVPSTLFAGLNLSALSPSLIESELFGHRKGAFTGALSDRKGWLESCPPYGTVFLDEVGELDPGIQVKLLRVLQTRTFQRLGETTTRHFSGKIVAATNRDLGAATVSGAIRRDFYYRLCADVVTTPSLAAQLSGHSEELQHLVLHVANGVVGPVEADEVASEVLRLIEKRIGASYAWPGNYRELEQCVRSVVVRGDYAPAASPPPSPQPLDGTMTEEELLRWYTALVYQQTGSYQEVARRLGIDRRTVKARL